MEERVGNDEQDMPILVEAPRGSVCWMLLPATSVASSGGPFRSTLIESPKDALPPGPNGWYELAGDPSMLVVVQPSLEILPTTSD